MALPRTITNLPEFHSVWADSLIGIINRLANDEANAKKIMIFNIRQAYILYRMDNQDQRIDLDKKLAELRADDARAKKVKGHIDCDAILQDELDAMALDKLSSEQLQVKMFTYMTLAGIKPVQNQPPRAASFRNFIQTTEV